MEKQTQHKVNCNRIFKHYDPSCKRCQELAAGAPARQGWQANYFKRKKEQEQRKLEAIKNHNCEKAGCGPICTAFDW